MRVIEEEWIDGRFLEKRAETPLRPLIVTTAQSHAGARSLAAIHSLEDRVDIIEAGQFIATNLHGWSLFKAAERKLTLEKLLTRYNEIVKACETDPALQIKFGN